MFNKKIAGPARKSSRGPVRKPRRTVTAGLEWLEGRVCLSLAFNLTDLPDGIVGDSYVDSQHNAVQFSVVGGGGPYTYSLGDRIANNELNNGTNQYALIDS